MTSALDNCERVVLRVSRLIALVGLFGMLILASATILDVFCRWLLNSPITGVRDASSLFTAVIIASCFALCLAERKDITIRFLGFVLNTRGKNFLEAFGNFVTMLVYAVITWQLWLYTNELSLDKETTLILGWPLHPWWRIVCIQIGICVPIQAVIFLQSVKSVFTGKNILNTNENQDGENQWSH